MQVCINSPISECHWSPRCIFYKICGSNFFIHYINNCIIIKNLVIWSAFSIKYSIPLVKGGVFRSLWKKMTQCCIWLKKKNCIRKRKLDLELLEILKGFTIIWLRKITYKINTTYLPILEIWITVEEWWKSTLDWGCKENTPWIQDSSSSAGEEG